LLHSNAMPFGLLLTLLLFLLLLVVVLLLLHCPCKVGGHVPPYKKLQAALRNSFIVVTVHLQLTKSSSSTGSCSNGSSSDDSSTEQLAGFVRAISDQTFHATLWDLMVDPVHQWHGVGKA